MYIQDDEMREIFRDEGEERLAHIEKGFLKLESSPDDAELIAHLFRECHSLKGAASMLGLDPIEELCHLLESIFAGFKSGSLRISESSLSLLFEGFDGVQSLYRWAVHNETSSVDVEALKSKMDRFASGEHISAIEATSTRKAEKPVEAKPEPEPEEEEEVVSRDANFLDFTEELAPPPSRAEPGPKEVSKVNEQVLDTPQAVQVSENTRESSKASRSISTLRVSASKLDRMVSYSGELVVTKNRFVHRVGEFQKLLSLWTEVERFLRYLWGRGNGEISREMLLSLQDKYQRKAQELGDALREIELGLRADCGNLNTLANAIEWGIRSTRLIPLSSVFDVMPRLVRDLSVELKKRVDFQIEGGHTAADKRVIEEIRDPLMHMIRNAMDHGIESMVDRKAAGKPDIATLQLRAYQSGGRLIIEIEDDGRGLNIEKIRKKAVERGVVDPTTATTLTDRQVQYLIFSSGFSTTEEVTDISGRGVGMDVVKSNIEALKGTIDIESSLGKGTLFRMKFPLTLSTTRVLLAEIGEYSFGIPVDSVVVTSRIDQSEIFLLQGRDTIYMLDRPIAVMQLHNLLGLEAEANKSEEVEGWRRRSKIRKNCIVVRFREQELALLVDELRNEQEVVLKPLNGPLRRVRNVSGASTLEDGSICIILNTGDLVESVGAVVAGARTVSRPDQAAVRILVVDDSVTIRTQEKRILEAAGFHVTIACDGQEGYEALEKDTFDLMISDVEMPRLDGLGLVKKVREELGIEDMPVILVTTLDSEADIRRGHQAGADGYLSKRQLDSENLLEAVNRYLRKR